MKKLQQNYQRGVMLQMTCFIGRHDFDQSGA